MNSQYVSRIIRACKLDVNLYEEVEADKSATFQKQGLWCFQVWQQEWELITWI